MSILRTAYLILLLPLLLPSMSFAQQPVQKCWIYLSDKDSAHFDPHSYFDQKAIDRRNKVGIDIFDPLCWPVKPEYVATLDALLDTKTATLRWFNAVVGYATPQAITQIASLPFVEHVDVIDRETETLRYDEGTSPVPLDEFDQHVLEAQTEIMGRSIFESEALRGEGIRIAVMDAGFRGVDVNPVFAHLFQNNQVKTTFDFVKDKPYVYHFSKHGSYVLSCMGGILDGVPMGLATEAEYILLRTERDKFEFKGEEENWLEGMEFADKEGADIINSSLGYTHQRYYQFDMNGSTAGVTRAASIAAKLGMLVVNSAGNEGNSWWQVIAAPSDGDSVLTVGGVEPYSRLRTDFSSYGPTADGRTKPNVTGFGWAIGSAHTGIEMVPGTSFSSPLVAGFAACAWQAEPSLTNMELFARIEAAGHLYPFYDYAHGYGIPQASRFLGMEEAADTTFDVTLVGRRLEVLPRRPAEMVADSLNLEKLEVNDLAVLPDVIYLHFKHPDGRLSYYATYDHFSFTGPRSRIEVDLKGRKGQIIRIYYNGYLYERKLE